MQMVEVLFAVDPVTLKVQDGKMFSNWYQVGRAGSSNVLRKKSHRTSGYAAGLVWGEADVRS